MKMLFRTCLAVAASVILVMSVASRLHAAGDPDDPIADLNRAIQERFKGVDKFFGLRRIVIPGDTPHRFTPESVSELSVVQQLRDRHLSVALYMAGRRVLEREPNLFTKEPTVVDRRVIFGPIAVTAATERTALPHAVDLIDESRAAFQQLQARDRYDINLPGWTFSARAIRAQSAECLTCHRERALGDALGAIWYAYRVAR